jgi:hypothetical protein
MSTICQNCSQHFDGNYCNNCGQTAKTHKLNFHFLWHDIQHGLLHVDKGIFFTAKELSIRPGHSIREFIEGKRVKHFKPISLVLILAGIFGFLYHFFNINIFANNINISGTGQEYVEVKNIVTKIINWITQHYAIIALVQLPILSLCTFIGFKKNGYNFIEHFILNAFLAGQRLLLHIVAFPIYYFANNTSHLQIVGRIIDVIGWLLMFWSLLQFFNKQKRIKTIFQSLLSFLIFGIVAFILLLAIFKLIILLR